MAFEDGLQQVEKANKLIVKANQMITDAHMKAFFHMELVGIISYVNSSMDFMGNIS
ncbi:hypothetical protein [Bacillus sp. OTU530]|uniref:hypothetical protein n=1 Tax=Bacillus sp. OTU530 TaxID=3043862 RepID=UPI00313C24E3